MKRLYLLFCGLMFSLLTLNAQTQVSFSENFDGATHTFTSNGWQLTTDYATSGTKSMHGSVPIWTNDSIVLTTPVYDCSSYGYVHLTFSHICKVASSDYAKVQYRLVAIGTQGQWQDIPATAYEGAAVGYANGFSAISYSQWQVADSLVLPTNAWWKSETFNLSNEVSYEKVQFRFVLKKMSTTATQINYGWLIDDFEVRAAVNDITPPVVEFLTVFPDTVYNVGPYQVNAKVATRTAAPIVPPYLHYTATNAVMGTISDSVLMTTSFVGDSIWRASIPQYIYGTTISYTLTAQDQYGNKTTANNPSSFISKRVNPKGIVDSIQVGYSNNSNYFYPFSNGGSAINYSQSLYKNAMIAPDTQVRFITQIAYYAAGSNAVVTKNNIDIYMTTTSLNVLTAYEDPTINSHQLVYSGPINLHQGWNEITLTYPFILPSGQNLIATIYDNSYSCNNTWMYWYSAPSNLIGGVSYTATQYFSSGYDCNNNVTYSGSVAYLPTTKFYFGQSIEDSSSVSVCDITSFSDTAYCSPTIAQPIVVEIKNEGVKNLTSAVIGWSLNGVQKNNINWTGNLPSGMDTTIQIGTYFPKLNDYDTFVVYVNMPNGVVDNYYADDTITKIVYGIADLDIAYTKKPQAIVFSTGPYDIEAKIVSRSGSYPANVNLIYSITNDSTKLMTKTDTLGMTYIGDNKWLTTIPCISFENTINHSITIVDTFANILSIADSYQITRKSNGGSYTIVSDTTLYAGDTANWNTARSICPFSIDAPYSWSRMLYLSSELKEGYITNLAFKLEEWDDDGSHDSMPFQNCYMKLVDDTIVNSLTFVDPRTDGATLVWQGTVPDLTGLYDYWVDFELTTPFLVQSGKSLLVYWVDSSNVYQSYGNSYWWYNSAANMDTYTGNTYVGVGTGTIWGATAQQLYASRPVARFQYGREEAVAPTIASYIYTDTTNYNPRGDEESVIVDDMKTSWSKMIYPTSQLLNGGGTISKIGFYLKEVDDDGGRYAPVTKPHIFIYMKATTDTVLTPATTYSHPYTEGATLVWHDSVPAFNTSWTDYWYDFELQTPFTIGNGENLIVYMVDSSCIGSGDCYYYWYLNNSNGGAYTAYYGAWSGRCDYENAYGQRSEAPVARFYIQGSANTTPSQYVYTDTTNYNSRGDEESVIVDDMKTSWSKMIYPASQLLNGGGTISKIGFYLKEVDDDGGRYAPVTKPHIFIYMKATTDTVLTPATTYSHPYTEGATLVWHDSVPAFNTSWTDYWYDFELQTPFTIGNGENLIVYMVDSSCIGSGDCYYYWYLNNSNGGAYTAYYGAWSGRCDYENAYGQRSEAPVARFYYDGGSGTTESIKDAVAMVNIVSPVNSVNVGNHPIKVVIRNKGTNTLDSCKISYSINGATPIVYNYQNSLEEDFVDTVIIGTYTPTNRIIDTILVYVSYPNGVNDTLTLYDDTLSVSVIPCNGPLSGTYTIGSSANAIFNSFEQFKQIVGYCGMSGKVTLAFESGDYGAIDLKDFTTLKTANDTLVITSLSGNAADVDFFAPTQSIFNIADNNNIYLNNITISKSEAGDGVYMYENADNIEIANCIILTSYRYSGTGINISSEMHTSGSGLGVQGNVRIISNEIVGFYNGIKVNNPQNSTTNWGNGGNTTIVGNTIKDFYYYGIDIYNMAYIFRITDNKFVDFSGASSASVIYGYGSQIDTIARNIFITGGSGTGYGIQLQSMGDCYIINNELIRKQGQSSHYALTISNTPTYVYHNTFFNTSRPTSNQYAIYVNGNYPLEIQNNLFYHEPYSNSPIIYVVNANVLNKGDIDYNNYYSVGQSNTFTLAGSSMGLSAWQNLYKNDNLHSIAIAPIFNDTSINTDISNYKDMICKNVGVNEDIIGNTRLSKTTMGCHAPIILSTSPNLTMSEFVEPRDIVAGSGECVPDYTPIKLVVKNMGDSLVNFTNTPMKVSLQITGAVSLNVDTTISIDSLDMYDSDTIEIIDNINLSSGVSYLTAYLTCLADTIYRDDTLSKIYVGTMTLPMDEDFANGMPATLSVINNTTDGWAFTPDSNVVGNVVSQFGGAMLAFNGNRGANSMLYTSQINLTNVTSPIVEFWYYHDTSSTSSNMDYTSVAYTLDNGTTFHRLIDVFKNNGTDHGWTKYTLPLDSAIGNSCVRVVFNAMHLSSSEYNGEQYLDRIIIKVKQDLSLTSLSVPELTSCDYTGKELGVVIGNETTQDINFESNPTSLQVNITGDTTLSYNIPLNSGIINGLNNDTLIIDNSFDFNPGTYYVYAKVVTAIDETPANDVLYDTIIVNPSIGVVATQVTGGNDNTDCISIGSLVNQVVTLENDGNMDMEDVILTLNVYDITGAKVQTIEDTLAGVFAVNQTTTYTFAEAYEVPEDVMYNVEIVANPMCNASLTYTDILTECVDQSDVEVTAFINPVDDENCSSVGENIKVTVRVSNNNPNEDASGVVLHAIVTANGNTIASWTETLDDISAEDYIDFEFPQGFNVPSEADYTIVAYVNTVDAKAENDTLSMTKCTDLGLAEQDGNVVFLGQNIPNPATTQTVVNYQVPTEGTVVFTLTTVTGQVIYTTTQEVEAGRNSVEFNTENLAAGIYFYTMDFNGQRLTKKMTIRK